MKIDRLIGILAILMQREKVTAPFLADKFEVSRRTINRDVEDLCKAGIPLVTTQGKNGGITVMEGYRVDKTLLTGSDMKAILAGLRSLDSVSKTNRYQQLMDKLSAGSSSLLASNSHIVIDLSSWYKDTLTPKIELMQRAIDRNEKIMFTYYSPSSEGERIIEPYFLVFQWASWYVWGYCETRRDYRMFKLNRIQELESSEQTFEPRQIPAFEIKNESIFPTNIQAEVLLAPEMKWRLIEEYGVESFVKREDGRLLFRGGFQDKQSLFGWLLSFENQAELLEPEEFRREFREMLKEISEKYV